MLNTLSIHYSFSTAFCTLLEPLSRFYVNILHNYICKSFWSTCKIKLLFTAPQTRFAFVYFIIACVMTCCSLIVAAQTWVLLWCKCDRVINKKSRMRERRKKTWNLLFGKFLKHLLQCYTHIHYNELVQSNGWFWLLSIADVYLNIYEFTIIQVGAEWCYHDDTVLNVHLQVYLLVFIFPTF